MIEHVSRRARNGITLIELIVAMAAGLILFGLVIGILIRTSAATNATVLKESMRQEARLITDAIVKSLKQILPAGELAQGAAAGVTHFAENQMQFLSLYAATESQPVQYVIANGQDATTQLNHVVMKSTPIIQEPSAPVAETETGEQVLGIRGENLESEVRFLYASTFDMLSPQWTVSLEPGMIPRVVEITVIVSDPAERVAAVTVTTSLALPSSKEQL